VLLDRHRVIGAALDGRVVGDDHAAASLDDPDRRHDPGTGGVALVEVLRRERRELEQRGARVAKALDAIPDEQLAALDMTVAGPFATTGVDSLEP